MSLFSVLVVSGLVADVRGLTMTRGGVTGQLAENPEEDYPGHKRRPHIIFVVADDLGFHDASFSGGGIQTPALDRLARGGRVLEKYYVQPSCAPTRATIMTGRHCTSHGVTLPFDDGVALGLNLNETLLPQVLQRAGYVTHAVGKWHLGFFKEDYTPTFRGFTTFYGYYGQGESYTSHIHKGGFDFRFENRSFCGYGCSKVLMKTVGQYSTTLFTVRAVNIIKEHDVQRPLFLYLAWQAVHAPKSDFCPPWIHLDNSSHHREKLFSCALKLADHGLARVVQALEAKQMLRDSLIVFSSDNGGATSTSRILDDDIGSSNWPLRGGKHTLFEGGVRVAGFVWAGWWATGDTRLPAKYDGIIGSVDWFPTLLEAANVGFKPHNLDGVSQWRALAYNDGVPRDGLFIAVAQYGFDNLSYAYRFGDWKFVLGKPATVHHPWGWSGPYGSLNETTPLPYFGKHVLYNITADPSERVNLAFSHPRVVEMMEEKLAPYEQSSVNLVVQEIDLLQTAPMGAVWGPWQ